MKKLKNKSHFVQKKIAIGVIGALIVDGTHAEQGLISFNIASQKAASALISFAEQADITVLVKHDAREVELTGIQGKYTIEEAIQKLLQGSGLECRVNKNSIVVGYTSSSRRKEVDKPVSLFSVLAAAVSFIFPPVLVNAQDVENNKDIVSIEEVVVTATRRETSLLETPIAITAVSQAQLKQLNISNVSGLNQLVPGMQIRDNGADGQGSVEINLRGIGNSNFIETGESNVSFNIDGVYTARPQATLQMFNDVARVEVARGPQGTLSGRNATAGSINVIPNKPEFDEIEGSVEVEGGSEDAEGFKGVLNLPLSDTLALRLNYASYERESAYNLLRDETDTVSLAEGFAGVDGDGNPTTTVTNLISNFGDGITVPYFESRYGSPEDNGVGSHGSKDVEAYRISALWQPADTFSWLVAYEGFSNKALGAPLSIDCDRADCEQFYSPNQVSQSDPFTSFISFKGKMDQDIDNLRSVLEYDIPGLFSVKYTYGRSDFEHEMIQDVDAGAAIEIAFVDQPWLNDSDVHDLQLTSNSGGKLLWTAGLFSFKEVSDRRLGISFFTPGWSVFSNPEYTVETKAVYADFSYELSDKFDVFFGLRRTNDQKSNRGATRHSLTTGDCAPDVAASPLNQAEGGVFFHAGIDALVQPSCLIANNEAPDTDESFSDFRLGFNYQWSDDINTYFTVASGHKAKLQDQRLLITKFAPERVVIPVKTEKLISWEVGAKGSALDGKINFASALFYMDYTDKQEAFTYNFGDTACDLNGNGILDTNPDGTPGPEAQPGCGLISGETFDIDNPTDLDDQQFSDQSVYAVVTAPELDIYGFELEASAGIGTGGYLSGFLTYTRAEYGDFLYSNVLGCPNPDLDVWCRPHSVKGNTPRSTPEWTLNLTYSHTFYFANGSRLIPTINAYYRSEYFLSPENSKGIDPALVEQNDFADGTAAADNAESELFADNQEASVKVNFNLAWVSPSNAFTFEVFGTNIFDEEVRSHMRVDSGQTPLFVFEEPGQFGARLRYDF